MVPILRIARNVSLRESSMVSMILRIDVFYDRVSCDGFFFIIGNVLVSVLTRDPHMTWLDIN